MTDDTGSGLASASLLRRVVDVKPNELAATRASFIFFFFVLCSWFVLRPIRDLIAVTTGVRAVPERALALGYQFRHTDLDAALADLLKR